MVLEFKRLTVEEFDEFVQLPENDDKLFEFIGGEIVEVPSRPAASQIAGVVSALFYIFLKGKGLGHLTGEAGGYMVSGERYMPDVAFISKVRHPKLATIGYNPNPPELVVEVDFPSTLKSQHDLRIKIVNYLAAGTVVWLVLPETKTVEVYQPGHPMKPYRIGDTLDGSDVLPGFTLAVKDIFPSE
jgi:Uma2 family endonuclease